MIEIIFSVILAVLSAIGVVTVLGHFINKKEMQEFSKWLDIVEKELKKREVEK